MGNTMSNSKGTSPAALDLDPDRPVWERQYNETEEAWRAFSEYLLSEKRKIGDHGPSAYTWSKQWSWTFRVFEWDNHAIRSELALQERNRVSMNDRHRRIAQAAQSKVVTWLQNFDATRMTAGEATKLLDVATRLEHIVNGGTQTAPRDVEPSTTEPEAVEGSFIERLTAADLQIDLRNLAKYLNGHIGGDPR